MELSKERQAELGIDLTKVNAHQLKEIEEHQKNKKWDGIIRINVSKNSNFWLWSGLLITGVSLMAFITRENYGAAVMCLQSMVIYIGWIKSKESNASR